MRPGGLTHSRGAEERASGEAETWALCGAPLLLCGVQTNCCKQRHAVSKTQEKTVLLRRRGPVFLLGVSSIEAVDATASAVAASIINAAAARIGETERFLDCPLYS